MLPPEDGPKPKPRFDQVNVARQRIIRRNLDHLKAKGASDDEIESYLRDDEGLAPANEPTPAKPLPPESGAERAAGPLMAVAQGGTFNLADEAAGGLHAITRLANGKPFGENYREGRDAVRGLMDTYGKRHHKEQIALEMAGGLAPATTLPVLKNLGAVKGGAAFGAAYGAGGAEGDLSDRVLGAGVGAGAGAVGGALAEHVIAPVVAAGVRKAAPLINRAAPVVSNALNFLESRGIGLSTKNVGNAPPNATRPFQRMQETAEAYAAPKPRERAADVLLRNIERDKKTPAGMLAEVNDAPISQPLTMLELGEENVMGAARGARSVPSEAKRDIPRALIERQKGEHGRARAAVEGAAGVKPGDPHVAGEDLIAQRRANAQPLYEKAYGAGAVDDPAIREAMALPQFKAAFRRAQRIAKAEGVEMPDIYGESGAAPDVRTLDYVKRGLDDLIDSKTRGGKMGRTEARALRKRLDDVLAKVDEQVPDYAAARSQYAGDSRLLDAHEQGLNFIGEDDRAVARMVNGFTPGERDAYSKAALDAVNKEIRGTGDTHDVYNKIFGNGLKRDALKALVGDETFAGLEKTMNAMARRTQSLRFVTGGSNTVDKLGENIDLETDNLVKMLDAGTSPKKAMMQGVVTWLKNRRDGITKKTADDIGKMVTAGSTGTPEGRQALIDVLTELQDAAKRNAAKAASRKSAAPLTRPFASQFGSATAPRNERRN